MTKDSPQSPSQPDAVHGLAAIDRAISNNAVKTPPSIVHPLTPSTEPPLDVFKENVKSPATRVTLPKFGDRIETTPQLAFCIGLLSKDCDTVNQQDDPSQDMLPDTAAYVAWIKAMRQDTIERDRLFWLGNRMVDEFAKDAFMDSTEVAEMVLIGPVLGREYYRRLLSCMIAAFDPSVILGVDFLQGLVQLVQSAPPGSLLSDDLVKILRILRARLQDTHQQSLEHPYHLTVAVSRLLDVMADHKVEDLDRVEEHEPLSGVLLGLKGSSDPFLLYQVCYAFQALQYVQNDEPVLQTVLRHSTGAVDGLVKIAAVMKLDLGAVLEGLGKLQEVIGGTFAVVGMAYEGMCSLVESGRGVLESLKEGYGSGEKRPWYAAIRAAYALAQAGQFQDLNRLICEAPCRRDPLFQWGVCQLLGEIASDVTWNVTVRQQAVDLLGDLYRNDPAWGQDESVKTWMLSLIGQLSAISDQTVSISSSTLHKELRPEQATSTSRPYPLENRLPLPASSPILARVQKIPYLEYELYELKLQRFEEHKNGVYIHPQAKPSMKATDDTLFSLMEKVLDFLAGHRQVLLLLGDSGAGKSTFNHELEHTLWKGYKRHGPIPLYINLPTIDNPTYNLVEKQLQYHNFSEEQILEMKLHREFILICDGYDESQLKVNIHTTNHFNQPGQWKVKMIISCRTQYLGQDYRPRFQPQPADRYQRTAADLFQEAVIAAFSRAQIQQYITEYVKELPAVDPLQDRPSWTTAEYMDKLVNIPRLMDLVSNPFLLTLALDTLPAMVGSNKDLSVIRITRVQLYDSFVKRWLEVNRRRLESSPLSDDERSELEMLVEDNFIYHGIKFQKDFSTSIFTEHAGNPVVKYTHLRDRETWKVMFFSPDGQIKLLRESSTVMRSGAYFRFLHRSLLEYFYSRTIYDPDYGTDADADGDDDQGEKPTSDLMTALTRMNLVQEPSIVQFLAERVPQNSSLQEQLRTVIEQSKIDASAAIAAANAITILVRAGVSFHGSDLRGVKIPGADLSEGQFDSAQLQGSDLTRVNLSRSWLRQTDMSKARLEDIWLGELPYLEVDGTIEACSYSPDGSKLAMALQNYDGVEVYSTTTWTSVQWISDDKGVQSLAFSPDGQQIVFGGNSCRVRLWDIIKGEEVLVLEGHTDYIHSVAFSPCGMLLASAGEDETVRLWNSQTGESLFVFEGHTKRITSVKFSPDGRQLVSGSRDGTIRFWDSKTGEPGLMLSPSLGDVESLAYAPDGRWIASGHDEGSLQLWDAVSGEPGPVLHGHTSSVNGVVFSPNGQWIASCCDLESVRLWDSSSGALLSNMTLKADLRDVAFSPDGRQLASGGDDEKVRLWDVSSSGWSICLQEDQVDHVKKVTYTPEGLSAISVVGMSVFQWCPISGAPGLFFFDFPEDTEMHAMKVSPDGGQIAMGPKGGPVHLWDHRKGTVVCVLEGHGETVEELIYSPCSRWLFSIDYETDALLWDLHDTRQERHVRADIDEEGYLDTFGVAFSLSGRRLAIHFRNRVVRIYDLPSRGLVMSRDMTREDPWTLTYSPNGQQLAVGCVDGSIYLWDDGQSEDEDLAVKLDGHQSCVHSVAYSPCGQWIASGSEDWTARLWHLQPDKRESWSCAATVCGFFERVHHVAWNPVVPMEFVTHSWDESIRVWQVLSDGGAISVRMRWGSNIGMLCANGLVLKNAIGLSPIHQKLLAQRGAVDCALDSEEDGSD